MVTVLTPPIPSWSDIRYVHDHLPSLLTWRTLLQRGVLASHSRLLQPPQPHRDEHLLHGSSLFWLEPLSWCKSIECRPSLARLMNAASPRTETTESASPTHAANTHTSTPTPLQAASVASPGGCVCHGGEAGG